MRNFKQLYKVLLLVTVFGFVTSCSKDFLDTKPLSEFSEVDVWNDPALVETFINQMYRQLGIPFSIGMLSSYVDESQFTPDWGVTNFNNCLLTPDDIPGWQVSWFNAGHTGLLRWSQLYKSIRMAIFSLKR